MMLYLPRNFEWLAKEAKNKIDVLKAQEVEDIQRDYLARMHDCEQAYARQLNDERRDLAEARYHAFVDQGGV